MRLVIASFICLAIICIGIYFKVYAVSAQQTTVTSGVVNQGADSSIALKKEYQVTSYKKNIATNARVVFADNSPLLIYAVTIPKSDDGSKNENMYGAFDKPKQNLAYLQINNISKEPLVAVLWWTPFVDSEPSRFLGGFRSATVHG